MRTHTYYVALVLIVLNFFPEVLKSGTFIAYSLKAAEQKVKQSDQISGELDSLGGITRPFCVVYDYNYKDLILVGQVQAKEQKLQLDDFIVALRSIFNFKTWPKVSIDKTETSNETQKQIVRFVGGIENTSFGNDLLQADIILKKIGLGEIDLSIWGVKSYFDLYENYWKETGNENDVQSRFWFKTDDPVFADREGVAVINKIGIVVDVQTLAAVDASADKNDPIGHIFARSITENYDEISNYYPEINRLNTLFRLVGLCAAVKMLEEKYKSFAVDLDFWLNEYKIKQIETLQKYPLLKREANIESNGKIRNMLLDGGIELKALLSDVRDGSTTALREIILKCRPNATVVTWKLPIQGWEVPGYEGVSGNKYDKFESIENKELENKIGCSLSLQISPTSVKNPVTASNQSHFSLFPKAMPQVSSNANISRQNTSAYSKIGGVMLQGAAQLKGENNDLSFMNSNFSFVLSGENSRVDPVTFRQFITSLWAVYYAKTPPGISIDPIAPGVEKHLVRYIGDVINSDLGRVMREADYTMKKWAVGTETPAVEGFKSIDEITGRRDDWVVGASRRFWFVPEDMSFTKNDNVLLFDHGIMTLKTEYIFQNTAPAHANPADIQFAKTFTERYQDIAAKYPIYQELFDYAKLVSFAQFLKQNKVPMLWFLLANKDLVVTEDSPGVVDELAKGSKYFRNVEIRGGVEMDPMKGHYVYDDQAINALNKAYANLPSSRSSTTSYSGQSGNFRVPKTFSFDLNDKSYTVVPQHSPTSGKDRRGIRYQTDLAFREGEQPGLELVRYFDPSQRTMGEFGDGWHLLIPYQIMPHDSEKVEFQNVLVPKRMDFFNLISGEKEVLEFSTDRYSIVGWVPDSLKNSQVVGLFLMSDVTYRLADKIGNEFWFDKSGAMTDMLFGRDHHYHIEYNYREIQDPALMHCSFNVAVDEYQDFLNVRVPKKIKLVNAITDEEESFSFNTDRYDYAGYIPDDEEKSQYKNAALMNTGSLQLYNKNGTITSFNRSWEYESNQSPVIVSYSLGDLIVDFDYSMFGNNPVITSAAIKNSKTQKTMYVIQYDYDESGKLCHVERKEKTG